MQGEVSKEAPLLSKILCNRVILRTLVFEPPRPAEIACTSAERCISLWKSSLSLMRLETHYRETIKSDLEFLKPYWSDSRAWSENGSGLRCISCPRIMGCRALKFGFRIEPCLIRESEGDPNRFELREWRLISPCVGACPSLARPVRVLIRAAWTSDLPKCSQPAKSTGSLSPKSRPATPTRIHWCDARPNIGSVRRKSKLAKLHLCIILGEVKTKWSTWHLFTLVEQ